MSGKVTGTFKVLRVEERPSPEAPPSMTLTVATEAIRATASPKMVASDDVEYWRKLAIQTGERLAIAEEQAKALRDAADEARSRFSKYKGRLDSAQARNNELQVQVVMLSADNEKLQAELAAVREEMRSKLVDQATFQRKVYEVRQQQTARARANAEQVEKEWWDLFVELSVSPPTAGEEQR